MVISSQTKFTRRHSRELLSASSTLFFFCSLKTSVSFCPLRCDRHADSDYFLSRYSQTFSARVVKQFGGKMSCFGLSSFTFPAEEEVRIVWKSGSPFQSFSLLCHNSFPDWYLSQSATTASFRQPSA